MTHHSVIVKPVILCGGSGTRLWPMSRKLLPKQFLPLSTESATLLQETARRAQQASQDNAPIVVCNEEHRFLVADQLTAIGVHATTVLEPEGRNTAAAIAVAALLTETENPVLLVLPSDHSIGEPVAFADAVRQAADLAVAGSLITFGISPASPESGFGYIERGELIEGSPSAYRVARFVEKPSVDVAKALIATGRAYWNSGMFAFRSTDFLEELERFRPDILAAARCAVELSSRDMDFIRLGKEAFIACPAEAVDRAVMEKTKRAAVVPAAFSWSDVGSWTALWEISEKDSNGNAIRGDVSASETTNSLIFGSSRLVTTLGVNDLVIVETSDAILVADRSRAQEVREIVNNLRDSGREEHLSHLRVYRPWGYFENLDSAPGYLVKRIMVKSGAALSLQMHHHRAEHWVVVKGTARVTKGDQIITLNRNESVYIPLGETHRLENPTDEELHLIEVQSGDIISEEDIVRFDDRYKR